ncbi:hypothetical protein MTO96_005128 [Rhipicephalus appendiculatus]
MQTRLARILYNYRQTPLSGGKTPAMLLMGRELRSRLDNLLPSETECDLHPGTYDFLQKDEPIWVRNYGCLGDPWTQARVQTTERARMVTAETPEGELVRRPLDQVKPRVVVGQRATAAASLTQRRQSRRQHDDCYDGTNPSHGATEVDSYETSPCQVLPLREEETVRSSCTARADKGSVHLLITCFPFPLSF